MGKVLQGCFKGFVKGEALAFAHSGSLGNGGIYAFGYVAKVLCNRVDSVQGNSFLIRAVPGKVITGGLCDVCFVLVQKTFILRVIVAMHCSERLILHLNTAADKNKHLQLIHSHKHSHTNSTSFLNNATVVQAKRGLLPSHSIKNSIR